LKAVNYFTWFVLGPECIFNMGVAIYFVYKLNAHGLTRFYDA